MRTFFYLLLILFLILLLSFERSLGLPVLFFSFITIFFSRLKKSSQVMIAIFLGIFLAVIYVISFWLAISIIALCLFSFDQLKKIITSNTLRLLLVVFLVNCLIFLIKNFHLNQFFVVYHFIITSTLFFILFFMAGIGFKKNSIKLSKRMRDEIKY